MVVVYLLSSNLGRWSLFRTWKDAVGSWTRQRPPGAPGNQQGLPGWIRRPPPSQLLLLGSTGSDDSNTGNLQNPDDSLRSETELL